MGEITGLNYAPSEKKTKKNKKKKTKKKKQHNCYFGINFDERIQKYLTQSLEGELTSHQNTQKINK